LRTEQTVRIVGCMARPQVAMESRLHVWTVAVNICWISSRGQQKRGVELAGRPKDPHRKNTSRLRNVIYLPN